MAHDVDSDGRVGYCARFHYAVELIDRRWNGAIIAALHAGQTRYSEVRDTVPGLSDHLLCQRLRELEANGLLERHVTPSTPVHVRYQLTAMGLALGPVIDELSTWADRWLPADARRFTETIKRPRRRFRRRRARRTIPRVHLVHPAASVPQG